MVHATIRLDLSPEKASEALEVIHSVAERTRVEPGCISCRIYHEVQHDYSILIEELWSSQDELDRHLRSSDFRSVLLAVEMAKGRPEIQFNVISHSSGMETIEKARALTR